MLISKLYSRKFIRAPIASFQKMANNWTVKKCYTFLSFHSVFCVIGARFHSFSFRNSSMVSSYLTVHKMASKCSFLCIANNTKRKKDTHSHQFQLKTRIMCSVLFIYIYKFADSESTNFLIETVLFSEETGVCIWLFTFATNCCFSITHN